MGDRQGDRHGAAIVITVGDGETGALQSQCGTFGRSVGKGGDGGGGRVVDCGDGDGGGVGCGQRATGTGVAVVVDCQGQQDAGRGCVDIVGVGQGAAAVASEQVVQLCLGAIENQGAGTVAAGNGDAGSTGNGGQGAFGSRQRDRHVAAVVIRIGDGKAGALQGQRATFSCSVGEGGDGGGWGCVDAVDPDDRADSTRDVTTSDRLVT